MTYGFYQPQQQFQTNFSKAFTVTSKEQATNTPVDFNGLPTFFYNQNANEVYLKQFDVRTGSAIWKEFRTAEPVEDKPKYVSIEEFNALSEKIESLMEKKK